MSIHGVRVAGAGTQSVTATIASGATGLSAAVDLREYGTLIGISMPGTWVAANLTFQTSADGGTTYQNFYDSVGNEYTVTAAASRNIMINAADFLGVRYLKIRSGTSGTPVNQTASRDLILTTLE